MPWSVSFYNWKEELDEGVDQKILSVQVFLKIERWTSILNESEKEECDDDLCEKGLRSVVMAYTYEKSIRSVMITYMRKCLRRVMKR